MAEDTLAELLPRLARLSSLLGRGELFDRAVAATELRLERPAMTVLVNLHMSGGPLRIGQIATLMHVAGPHVTRHVQGLERRGLTERVVDQEDQRARLITLTAEGRLITGRYLHVVRRWFADAMAGWTAQDQRDLTRLVDRLVSDLTTRLDADL
ncbi:MAG TPA: MarR family transcriptional regulator [Candidatus Dormibacteraeota bacterium]|jgi:DNA-binding MarR family transcriptional regulator|nr:MarR family transcriptional regulator [Candidatus Dormibacteraeota bacterium]